MEIKNINIDELKPYKNNPRKNAGAVDYVANSIKAFGFKVPIIIDKNNEIVAGHTRYLAAKKLEMQSVPCIVADDLTPEQIKAFRLADNKTHELSYWDFELLNEELGNIFDINMNDFGFDIISQDDYNTDFTLPDGDKSNIETMSFSLAQEQAKLIKNTLAEIKKSITANLLPVETFGNENPNGNALYEVVRQWDEQRKLN